MESNDCVCDQYFFKLKEALSTLLSTTTAMAQAQPSFTDSGFVNPNTNFSFSVFNNQSDLLITSIVIIGLMSYLFNMTRRNVINGSRSDSKKTK